MLLSASDIVKTNISSFYLKGDESLSGYPQLKLLTKVAANQFPKTANKMCIEENHALWQLFGASPSES